MTEKNIYFFLPIYPTKKKKKKKKKNIQGRGTAKANKHFFKDDRIDFFFFFFFFCKHADYF